MPTGTPWDSQLGRHGTPWDSQLVLPRDSQLGCRAVNIFACLNHIESLMLSIGAVLVTTLVMVKVFIWGKCRVKQLLQLDTSIQAELDTSIQLIALFNYADFGLNPRGNSLEGSCAMAVWGQDRDEEQQSENNPTGRRFRRKQPAGKRPRIDPEVAGYSTLVLTPLDLTVVLARSDEATLG